MKVYTIGFTQSTAESFFGRLMAAKVKRVLDVRLNNTSQLAGFAKVPDLAWFLTALGGINYVAEPLLAPTGEILDGFKKNRGAAWPENEKRFLGLLESRRVEQRLDPALFDGACLLCSEATPHRCHRRLVVEYLGRHWKTPLEVRHL